MHPIRGDAPDGKGFWYPATLVEARPEVLECYSMTGQHDYLVKIVASSISAYDEFLSAHLLPIPGVRAVNSSIVLKRKKHTTVLPIAPEPVRHRESQR